MSQAGPRTEQTMIIIHKVYEATVDTLMIRHMGIGRAEPQGLRWEWYRVTDDDPAMMRST